MDYITQTKNKNKLLTDEEIKKTFEMLGLSTIKSKDESEDWFLDSKPLKIKIQNNTLRE